jgi:hypothetical protein
MMWCWRLGDLGISLREMDGPLIVYDVMMGIIWLSLREREHGFI